MTDARPNPINVIEDLALAAKLYPAARALASGQASNGALGDFITGTASHDLLDLLNFGLLEKLGAIDTDVHTYAKMLADDSGKQPPGHTTVTLIMWLKRHVGHFTHGDDAQTAHAFADDADRWAKTLEHAADPGGWVPIDLHEECIEDNCNGTYRVAINRDEPLPYELAYSVLKGKDARCSKNKDHVMRVGNMKMVRRYELMREVHGA